MYIQQKDGIADAVSVVYSDENLIEYSESKNVQQGVYLILKEILSKQGICSITRNENVLGTVYGDSFILEHGIVFTYFDGDVGSGNIVIKYNDISAPYLYIEQNIYNMEKRTKAKTTKQKSRKRKK